MKEENCYNGQMRSQINAEIRQLLDKDFRFVRIRGEISNVRQPFSGHNYFILKDNHSQLDSVLFKNQRRWLSNELERVNRLSAMAGSVSMSPADNTNLLSTL